MALVIEMLYITLHNIDFFYNVLLDDKQTYVMFYKPLL